MDASAWIRFHLSLFLLAELAHPSPLPATTSDLKLLPSQSSEGHRVGLPSPVDVAESSVDPEKRGWADSNMAVWGKRAASNPDDDHLFPDASGWQMHPSDSPKADKSQSGKDIRLNGSKRKWGDNNMAVWGKRRSDGSKLNEESKAADDESTEEDGLGVKRKWGENNMAVWGKRGELPTEIRDRDAKRKWGESNMAVWGKRSESPVETDKEKRKWGESNMAVWGKRSESHVETGADKDKRKWGESNMAVWGKRSEGPVETDADKRKWGESNMAVWGKRSEGSVESGSEIAKRKWGESNMAVWGKRSEGAVETGADKEKRKWGESNMAVWGKRSERSIATADETEKRKWGENNMAVWGKRSEPSAADDKEKRKWGDTNLAVWGKRTEPAHGGAIRTDAKRKWGETSMAVWGKRSQLPYESLENPNSETKRKWGESNMAVWGKRDDDVEADAPGYDTDEELQALRDKDGQVRGSAVAGSPVKRKWGDNTMQVWGKRAAADDVTGSHYDVISRPHSARRSRRSVAGHGGGAGAELRALSDAEIWQALQHTGHARASHASPASLRGGPKRNWETNTMRVWGKRGAAPLASRGGEDAEKPDWSADYDDESRDWSPDDQVWK